MAANPPDESGAPLVRAHRVTIAVVGACALVSWLRAGSPNELPESVGTLVLPGALAVTMAIIVARQIALRSRDGHSRRTALLVTYALCGVLGVFGAALAFLGDDGSRGALFALGAAIFALGSPPRSGLFAAR